VKRYTLSAVTIFLSAFLIFQIQLIFGKLLLPWFGGSSSVWATSMLFFTGMLFLGYLYAYVLTLCSHRAQIEIHLSLIVLGTIWVLISLIVWHSGAPPLESLAGEDLPPAVSTLLVLLLTIGITYFLLSTTGPLIQYWYGVTTEKEPYSLYAVSNIGSFLALISYPFLVEPFTTLEHQKLVWGAAFLLYTGLSASICLGVKAKSDPFGDEESTSASEKMHWVLYALFPSLMLVAVTTHITQVIAPIPLLWMMPLSMYLLTFVIAFAGARINVVIPFGLAFSAIIAWRYANSYGATDYLKIGADLAFLFFLGFHCHGELYKARPRRERSALFYLAISFGGMAGAFLASIAAPLLLNDFWEFPFGCAVAIVIAVHAIAQFGARILGTHPELLQFRIRGASLESWPRIVTAMAAATVVVCGYLYIGKHDPNFVLVSRNFYGSAKVYQDKFWRVLIHGNTRHGVQFLDPKLEHIPTSYYGPETVVGRAVMFERSQRRDNTISIGVLGLGIGTMAAYCNKGDSLTFYEIDRRISKIAYENFTYLAQCPQAQIHFGDARLLLDKEYAEGKKGNYDLIVADAFVDDSIPVHLITRQAIARYMSHLRGNNGILAIHVSNRHLDLLPMLMSIAKEERLSIFYEDTIVVNQTTYPSQWVLFCRWPIFKGPGAEPAKKPVPAWTDDYSNLFSVIVW
jgi:hypothetical protein